MGSERLFKPFPASRGITTPLCSSSHVILFLQRDSRCANVGIGSRAVHSQIGVVDTVGSCYASQRADPNPQIDLMLETISGAPVP